MNYSVRLTVSSVHIWNESFFIMLVSFIVPRTLLFGAFTAHFQFCMASLKEFNFLAFFMIEVLDLDSVSNKRCCFGAHFLT